MDLYQTYNSAQVDPVTLVGTAALFLDEYLAPHLASFVDSEILELGAGTGATLTALRARGFQRVRGADISPAQVAVARRNGVEVELCDGLLALRSCKPGSVAALILLDVLEHLELEDAMEWLAQSRACLQAGGLVLVRVPNGEGLFGGALRYGDITHKTAYTKVSIQQLFATVGLELVEVRPCRPVVHNVASFVRASMWQVVEAFLRVASAAESGQWRDPCLTRNLFAVARRGPNAASTRPDSGAP